MRIVVISDTHGDHRQMHLPVGDTIIHAGDMTAHGSKEDAQDFINWFDELQYEHKILVAGNHDWYLETDFAVFADSINVTSINYLNDTGIEIDGIRFWGSPITPEFFNWAFQRKLGDEIDEHWQLIPAATDILITHGPPFGIMDLVPRDNHWDKGPKGDMVNAGCDRLLKRVIEISPAYHLFGHIHEGYGRQQLHDVQFINASSMNASYRLQNQPIVFDFLPERTG